MSIEESIRQVIREENEKLLKNIEKLLYSNSHKNTLTPRYLSVAETAEILGKSEQFVRIGLQRKILPIGTAMQMSENRWNYHISAKKLREYIGDFDVGDSPNEE